MQEKRRTKPIEVHQKSFALKDLEHYVFVVIYAKQTQFLVAGEGRSSGCRSRKLAPRQQRLTPDWAAAESRGIGPTDLENVSEQTQNPVANRV